MSKSNYCCPSVLQKQNLEQVKNLHQNLVERSIINYRSSTIQLLRKEVIQPQIPLRLPCYDLALVADLTLGPDKSGTSGTADFRDLTGGVYKTRERIHRGKLIHDY